MIWIMVILLFANVTIRAAVGIGFFLQKLNFCLQHVMHLLRDMPLRINLSYPGKILVHPMTRQIFCNTPRLKCYLYLSLCHKKTFAVK